MTRRVLAIIVAVIVALIGAAGAIAYAAAADSRALAGQETVSVFMATSEIPVGTTADAAVSSKLMAPQQVVAKGVPAGTLTAVDSSNKALVATSTIQPGEVVMASRFGTLSDQTQSAGVPDGKVAITVSLADPQRVAPLLQPGSHIVIYDSFNPRNPKAALATPDGAKLREDAAGIRVTRVLLGDVQVIGVGSAKLTGTGSADTQAAAPAQSEGANALVTVAVTPAQALTLVHAIQTGTLYAGLRGKGAAIDGRAVVNDNSILAN